MTFRAVVIRVPYSQVRKHVRDLPSPSGKPYIIAQLDESRSVSSHFSTVKGNGRYAVRNIKLGLQDRETR